MSKALFNEAPAWARPWLNLGIAYSIGVLFLFGFQCLIILFFGQSTIKHQPLYIFVPFFGEPAIALQTTMNLLFIAHLFLINRTVVSARAFVIIDGLMTVCAAALWAQLTFVTRPYSFSGGGYVYLSAGIGVYALLHLATRPAPLQDEKNP